jgi:hypothetical protein
LLPAVEMQRSQSMAHARPELPTTKVPSSGVAGFPLQWWRRRSEIWVRRLLPRQLNQCLVTTRGQQCVVVPSNLLQPWCMGRSTRACSDSAAASSDLFLSRFSASRAQQGGIGAEEALEEEGAKATSRRGAGALRRGVAAHFPSIPTPRARLWGVTWWACLSLVETLHRAKSGGGGGRRHFPVAFGVAHCSTLSFIPFLHGHFTVTGADGLKTRLCFVLIGACLQELCGQLK